MFPQLHKWENISISPSSNIYLRLIYFQFRSHTMTTVAEKYLSYHFNCRKKVESISSSLYLSFISPPKGRSQSKAQYHPHAGNWVDSQKINRRKVNICKTQFCLVTFYWKHLLDKGARRRNKWHWSSSIIWWKSSCFWF